MNLDEDLPMCCDCSTLEGVLYVADPWLEDLLGKQEMIFMCKRCYRETSSPLEDNCE